MHFNKPQVGSLINCETPLPIKIENRYRKRNLVYLCFSPWARCGVANENTCYMFAADLDLARPVFKSERITTFFAVLGTVIGKQRAI